MAAIAGLLGGLLATMIDPFVIGAGVASYFIGRSWKTWAATGASIFVFAVALYALVVSLAGPNFRIPESKLVLLLAAITAWAAISYGVALAYARMKPPDNP
jgi:hypothetical protein